MRGDLDNMTARATKQKPDRNHVDVADEHVVRHLIKLSGKSKEEVVAAVEKVGTNMATVKLELGCR
jgi:Protein of unknown function (DUF3606)